MNSETALYLEFELLSEIIKEIQEFIGFNNNFVQKSTLETILRTNSDYYSEINDAIFGYYNMDNKNISGDCNELCDAAENYALENLTKLEDAFKPKEHELKNFGGKFISHPFMFNANSEQKSGKNDEKTEDSVTLDEVKHFLPSYLVKELENDEKTSQKESQSDDEFTFPSASIEPMITIKTKTSKDGHVSIVSSSIPQTTFFTYPPAYVGEILQQHYPKFMYYSRPPMPPPGFPSCETSIDELKKERQKKIEELLNRGKDRKSNTNNNASSDRDDSLGVDILKDDNDEDDDDSEALQEVVVTQNDTE